MTTPPTLEDLAALGLRIGTIVRAESNDGARDPAFKLWIDLGEVSPVQSSAKITDLYEPEGLIGKQVVVVSGFEPIRVGGFRSDVLVLGGLTDEGVVLLAPAAEVPPGCDVA